MSVLMADVLTSEFRCKSSYHEIPNIPITKFQSLEILCLHHIEHNSDFSFRLDLFTDLGCLSVSSAMIGTIAFLG